MLAHSLVTAKSADPTKLMLFLHGILGNRANWRGIARRFVAARPDWGAVLVDLREHGDSLGLQAPHGLQAVTDDLAELERSLDLTIGGAIGHSFGGKVVLEWLRSRANQSTEAWVIDASPSPSDTERDASATAEVLRTLESLPRRWPSREAFVTALAEAGTANDTQLWMQISHAGRQTPALIASEPVGPSDVGVAPPGGRFGKPRELTGDEIRDVIARFAFTAGIAKQTGFTGVQVHSAHGYLLSEFLSPRVNLRDDEWGGSLQNRSRLLLETVRAVRKEVGSDFPVAVSTKPAR